MLEFSFYLLGTVSGFVGGALACFAWGWRLVAQAQAKQDHAERRLHLADATINRLVKTKAQGVSVDV